MKKNFEQPELMVVLMKNSDIVTTSLSFSTEAVSGENAADAAGRRMDDWDAGY